MAEALLTYDEKDLNSGTSEVEEELYTLPKPIKDQNSHQKERKRKREVYYRILKLI